MTQKPPSLMDAFARMLSDYDKGFAPLLPVKSIQRLSGFVDGFCLATDALGIPDERGKAFFIWLRDVRREFPSQGWDWKLKQDFGADEETAIRKFLELARDFEAGHKSTP